MNTQEFIFVSVPAGFRVVGFKPGEVVEFEKELASFPHPEEIEYWSFFSYFFRDELGGNDATCFSLLWRFDKPWAELNRLRREAVELLTKERLDAYKRID